MGFVVNYFLIVALLLPCMSFSQKNRGRRPAQVVYTRDIFFQEFKNELEKSLYPAVKQRAIKKNQADKEFAMSKDGWSLSESIRDTSKSVTEPPYGELLATTTLKYESPKGFTFQTYTDFFEPTKMSNASSRYSKNNIGFSLSQDLMVLFHKSQYQLNIELVDVQSRATVLNKDKMYLSHVLNVVEWSYNLFTSLCERIDLEKTIKTVEGTLAVGQVQRSARTISTTEMLRIRSTYLNIKRQLDANAKQIALAQSRFLYISDEAHARAQELSKGPLQCDDSVETLKAIPTPGEDEIANMVNKHPALLEISTNRDSLKKQIEIYRNSRSLKFSGSLGYDKINNQRDITLPYDQIYAAITLTYQFKGKEFEARSRVISEQYQILGVDMKIEDQVQFQILDDLVKTIKLGQSQIPVVQDSIANASQLLKIIETQQSIGQLDASAIDSAYQSQLAALSDMRRLGDSIYKAATKMDEIRSATIGGRTEKVKLKNNNNPIELESEFGF